MVMFVDIAIWSIALTLNVLFAFWFLSNADGSLVAKRRQGIRPRGRDLLALHPWCRSLGCLPPIGRL
jgi:hypothetical protein